jgi:hypothetical protein
MIATLVTALLLTVDPPPPAPGFMGAKVGMTAQEMQKAFTGHILRTRPELPRDGMRALRVDVHDPEIDVDATARFFLRDGVVQVIEVEYDCSGVLSSLRCGQLFDALLARLKKIAPPAEETEGVADWTFSGGVYADLIQVTPYGHVRFMQELTAKK